MIIRPCYAAAAAALAISATPALAHDLGMRVTYKPVTGHYCIRPHREDATLTSGVRLYRTECRTHRDWARQGVTIEHRRLNIAAVDAPRG